MQHHYEVKNWNKFQHYKKRSSPLWIKVYKSILDDPEWHSLDSESAKVLVMLWLVASEANGYLPASNVLAFRLRVPETKLKSLISKLDHWIASTVLADCKQDAIADKRRGEDIKSNVVSAEIKKQAIEVLEFLNAKTNRNFEPVTVNVGLIEARLKEGAPIEDLRAVIAKKYREWHDDEKMRQYLRPATLFNREKFWQYQGELEVV